MTFSALIDWLDDRLNPIVVKELRQAVKSRLVVAILMLFLGIQLFLLGVFLVNREARGEMAVVWTAGAEAFLIQQIILLWTIAIIVPAYAAVRMGAERSDHNVDLMFSSTLSPGSIVWGKFFATLLLGMLVFSACAPFMTFTYLLRGIDIPTILTTLAMDLLAMLFSTISALLLASLPGTRVLKFVYCFIGFLFLVWLTFMLSFASFALVEDASGLEATIEYWPVTACFVAGLFAVMGLFYSYAVAVISPPTSNRMFPVRLFLAGLVVVTLTAVAVSSFFVVPDIRFAPVIMFLFLITPVLFFQLWISICEREHLGPRVLRAIPRSALLRPFAFLLFTGSAGGVLFSALAIGASLGFCALLLRASPSSASPMSNRTEEMAWLALLVHGLLALYVYCYGQSAVLIRHYLLGNHIRPGFTWVIAALLIGLGTTLPPMVAYFAYNDQMRYNNDIGWWYVPNPFIGYLELFTDGRRSGYRYADFDTICVWFLATWASLVTLLSMPWVAEQIRAFHPPRSKPETGNEELAAAILLDREPDMGVRA